jgi:hypothetical protein
MVRIDRAARIDEALADTFPASDPPAWNPGMASIPPPGPKQLPRVPDEGLEAGKMTGKAPAAGSLSQ